MFRKMRRFNQQLTENESVKILKKGKTGILAVYGDDGYPYAVPLNYAYDNGKIYFHCAKTGHKISAIKNCDKVSFCVTDKDDVIPERLTTHYKSVIIFGKARILENENEIINSARIVGLKYCNNPKFVDDEIKRLLNALCCVEIQIQHITGKASKELIQEN